MEDLIEYRDVPDHVGYRVGSDGSVWSAWKKTPGGRGSGQGHGIYVVSDTWKRARIKLITGQYPMVSLKKVDGKRRVYPLHRVVLWAFAGPKPKGMVCRHLDGDPHNNCADNLSWVTHQQNVNDTAAHGRLRIGERHPQARLTEVDVVSIRQRGAEGYTLDEIAEEFGVGRSNIGLIIQRKTWRHVK